MNERFHRWLLSWVEFFVWAGPWRLTLFCIMCLVFNCVVYHCIHPYIPLTYKERWRGADGIWGPYSDVTSNQAYHGWLAQTQGSYGISVPVLLYPVAP